MRSLQKYIAASKSVMCGVELCNAPDEDDGRATLHVFMFHYDFDDNLCCFASKLVFSMGYEDEVIRFYMEHTYSENYLMKRTHNKMFTYENGTVTWRAAYR